MQDPTASSRDMSLPVPNSFDMRPAVNRSDTTNTSLEVQPVSEVSPHQLPIHEDAPVAHPRWRSFFSMDGLLVSCLIPPLMGFGFVILGFYIIYGHTTLVVSRSIQRAALISQAFTALFSIWHLLALIPALSMVQRVRSEEWWRCLVKATTFNRVNSISSNLGGSFSHTVDVMGGSSSPYFKSAWIASLIAIVLSDITPGAIHIEIGTDHVPASFPVPALLPNSIYSNYSEPFFTTDPATQSSATIAPIYFTALLSGTYVKGRPPALHILVPRPNVSPGQGYRYSTDVYVHFLRGRQSEA